MSMTPADELVALRWQLSQMQQKLHAPSPAEADALRAAQVRADAALALHGEKAPSASLGETPLDYRRRLLRRIATHSPQFRSSRLEGLSAGVLATMEEAVSADAKAAAYARADAQPGTLTAFEERWADGRTVTKFHGDIGAFLAPFAADGARVKIKET